MGLSGLTRSRDAVSAGASIRPCDTIGLRPILRLHPQSLSDQIPAKQGLCASETGSRG